MQRNKQFGLLTALKVAVLLAVFFAAVRYLGVAVVLYGSFLAGVILGLWSTYKLNLVAGFAIVNAAFGGAVGFGFSGLICFIADPQEHQLLDPVSSGELMACMGSIGGLLLGIVFQISYAVFEAYADTKDQDRSFKYSLAVVAATAVVLIVIL